MKNSFNIHIKAAYMLGSLNRGGTEILLLDLFNQPDTSFLSKIGLYRKGGSLHNEFILSKTPLFKLNPGPKFRIWHYLRKLHHLFKSEGIDIVHTQQRIDTLYAWLACRGLKVKIIQSVHEFDFHTGILIKLLIQISLYLTDLNIFVSNFLKEYYISVYKLKRKNALSVIYNGIDFEKFITTSGGVFRKELKLNDQCLLLGMVGNFVHGHDHMTICRFLSLLNSKNIDFRFLFIGKQDLTESWLFDDCYRYCQENGLSEKSIFLGSRADVPQILNQLDAFIYASDHDTFGISVVEAIAAGIPVFINDWQVMKEITCEGEKANLYRSKDENDLFEKFMLFYSDADSYKEKAKENAIWARNKFSIQNHINQLYLLYSGLIKTGKTLSM